MLKDYWRDMIAEAMPLTVILPLLLIGSLLFFAGDLAYDAWMESREIVVETVDTISHSELFGWEDDKLPVESGEVHSIANESNRVRLD